MYRGYTYYKHVTIKNGERWKCTAGCKAFLSVRYDGNSVNAVHQHNHPPPIYRRTPGGHYFKSFKPRITTYMVPKC